MAAESEYRKKLEFLKSRVHYRGLKTEDIHERLYAINTLLYFQEAINFFENELKIAKNKLRLHVDDDIVYPAWCNLASWEIEEVFVKNAPKQQREACLMQWRSSANTIIDTEVLSKIIEYLPSDFEDLNYDTNHGKLGVETAIKHFAGPYFNYVNLEYSIAQAIKKLSGVLKELGDELHKKRSEDDYIKIGESTRRGFELHKEIISAICEYEEAKHLHELNSDWLEDRFYSELEKLYNSKLIDLLRKNVTRSESEKTEIWFELRDIQEDKQKEFYCALSKCCQKDGNKINFVKTDCLIGELIYKYRGDMTDECLIDFYKFLYVVEKIMEDSKTLGDNNDDDINERNNIDANYINALVKLENAKDEKERPLIRHQADWAIPFRIMAERSRFKIDDYAAGAAFISRYVKCCIPKPDSLSKNNFSGTNTCKTYPNWEKPISIKRGTDWERYLKIAEIFSKSL